MSGGITTSGLSGAHSAPPAGLRERMHDSWWVAWTFTLFLNWVAFLWIGLRARNRRWVLWSCVYALPFLAVTVLPEEGTASGVAASAMLILGVVSIVHAFRVRPAYIAQRRVLLGRPPGEVGPLMPVASLPEPGALLPPPAPGRSAFVRAIRGVGVVVLYLVVGTAVGTVVVVAGMFTDPCLPFCISDEYVRTKIVDGIMTAGGIAYLVLLAPMIRFWGTSRVWWIVLGGATCIGVLSLFAMWLTVQWTPEPAFCNC